MAAERSLPSEASFLRPSHRGGDHLRLVPYAESIPEIPLPPERYYAEGEEEAYYASYGTESYTEDENMLLFDSATVTDEQRAYVQALSEYYEAKLQARGFAPWDGVLIDRTSGERIPNLRSQRKEPIPISREAVLYTCLAADE